MSRSSLIAPVLVVLGALLPQALQAQMTCTGSACAALPVSTGQLDSIFTAVRDQYLNRVMEDMATAAVITGSQISPTGVVNLREFTVGLSVGAGMTAEHKVSVAVPGYGVVNDLPSRGVAAIPRAMVGTNLGYLFSSDSQNWKDPGRLSLYRFDLYLAGFGGSMNELRDLVKMSDSLKWNASSRSMGGELRYHLIEGSDRENWLFAFTGVSLGVGYSRVQQHIDVTQKNSKVSLDAGSAGTVIWKADNTLRYDSWTDVYPVTLRTGVQLLYFLRLSVGGGVAWAKGSSNLVVQRSGIAYLQNDLASALGLALPDALLTMRLEGVGGPPKARYSYATAGVEINIPFVKIFLDGQASKRESAASFGIRMAF